MNLSLGSLIATQFKLTLSFKFSKLNLNCFDKLYVILKGYSFYSLLKFLICLKKVLYFISIKNTIVFLSKIVSFKKIKLYHLNKYN